MPARCSKPAWGFEDLFTISQRPIGWGFVRGRACQPTALVGRSRAETLPLPERGAFPTIPRQTGAAQAVCALHRSRLGPRPQTANACHRSLCLPAMTLPLFDTPDPGRQTLPPGAVVLRGWAHAQAAQWVAHVRDITAQAPFRVMLRPIRPGG